MWIIRGFVLIPLALALASFALSPAARAVDPPPDGGYPGGNTAEGIDALFSITTGCCDYNTAIGYRALYSNTTGTDNTALGAYALEDNTTGGDNTAIGKDALQFNTTGYANTAIGSDALRLNKKGYDNTAIGELALNYNIGNANTATGSRALEFNFSGSDNTANGKSALYENTIGNENTANGFQALYYNTKGSDNTANGFNALYSNTTGINNAANGFDALLSNTTGDNNTADGKSALESNTTGSSNIALGAGAGLKLTTGNNNIDIGNAGVAAEANTIRIGKQVTHTATYIAGISGVTVAGGVGVIVDTNGHLGTVVSSERFKDAIKPMDKASEAILALKPVTFRYKHELDPKGIPQFGLVAEQVEKVNPDLVARDAQGKAYTVRYEAVNAMLLNEFLKAHRKIEEQAHMNQQQEAINSMLESTVARQQKEIKALTASLKEQASQIQKVSAQLEVTKPAPQMVANKQ